MTNVIKAQEVRKTEALQSRNRIIEAYSQPTRQAENWNNTNFLMLFRKGRFRHQLYQINNAVEVKERKRSQAKEHKIRRIEKHIQMNQYKSNRKIN